MIETITSHPVEEIEVYWELQTTAGHRTERLPYDQWSHEVLPDGRIRVWSDAPPSGARLIIQHRRGPRVVSI